MWHDRRLIDRLRLEHPLIQAPMAGASTPALAAAVANAGGLGSLGLGMTAPDAIRTTIRELRSRTNRAFNINLFTYEVPQPEPQKQQRMQARIATYLEKLGVAAKPAPAPAVIAEQIAAVLEEAPPVFSFTFGMPDRAMIEAFKKKGTVVIGTATSPIEARQLEQAGCDAVVAQGAEAGGHRGTFAGEAEDGLIGTMALVPLIADAVGIPVIAAGGIMDGRGVAAALLLGAAAVAMGTAFMACPESTAVHPVHRAALLGGFRPTTVTRAYTGRHARFIRNQFVADLADAEIPAYPHQLALTIPMRLAAMEKGDADVLPMMAGQGFPLVRAEPAAAIVARVIGEAKSLLTRAAT